MIKITYIDVPQSFDFFSGNDLYMKIFVDDDYEKQTFKTRIYPVKSIYFDETGEENVQGDHWIKPITDEVIFQSKFLQESVLKIRIELLDRDWFYNYEDDLMMLRNFRLRDLLNRGCYESYSKINRFCVSTSWKDDLI